MRWVATRTNVSDAGWAQESLVHSVTADASVNYGKSHSIFRDWQISSPTSLPANCYAPALHATAKHASKRMKYDVGGVTIQIYNEFSNSAKKAKGTPATVCVPRGRAQKPSAAYTNEAAVTSFGYRDTLVMLESCAKHTSFLFKDKKIPMR